VALDGIRDQPEAVTLLRRALDTGRVAHAYAFVGPEGSGRRATALAFAAALVAPDGGPAAERAARGRHPDVHLLGPTPPVGNPKGAQALRVETIRELERLAALKPMEARVKVFVVDEAEKMTLATPQAFLKTLEEPPAQTVIVLILTQLRALPPTVLSRCQVVRFRPRLVEGVPALLPDVRTDAHAQSLRQLALARTQGAVGAPARLAAFGESAMAAGRERSLDSVLRALRDCREAWLAIQGNVSPRLSVEVLLGRLVEAA
jgi:DNA polymerase III subunit delta'